MHVAAKAGHRDLVMVLLKHGVHERDPGPVEVEEQYLGNKATDPTQQRQTKTLLSQLYPAIQEYDGTYNTSPETAEERYKRLQEEKRRQLYGPHTQQHPQKWEGAKGPRKVASRW